MFINQYLNFTVSNLLILTFCLKIKTKMLETIFNKISLHHVSCL